MGFDSSTYTFDECLSKIIDYRGRTPRKTTAGIPLITAKIVKAGRIESADEFIAADDFEGWMTRGLPERGDVVLTTEAPLGEVGQIKTLPVALAQRVVTLRGKAGLLDNAYLLYALQAEPLRSGLTGRATGTTVVGIKQSELRKVEIDLPPIEVQREIARVLSALDDRIDHNRALAANLEAIARALFKSWFVDFDPVRAKAAGEAPPGLAPDLAALFPDRFVDSELGEIPEGWAMRTIADLAEVVGGSTPSTKNDDYWFDGQHHWATPKDLAALSSPVLLSTERKVTDAGLAQISSGLLPPGTVLLSSRAPIGYLAIAAMPVAINQGFIAMKPKSGVSNLYLLYWAKTSHKAIVANANGSTFLEISKKNFRPIPAIDAGTAVMTAFDSVATPLFERVVCAEKEIATLTELRDLLLPRLISGKLRVEDAEMEFVDV